MLVGMFFDTSRFPDSISIRSLGAEPTVGEGKYVLDRYLQQRGDANIRSTADLIGKSVFYTDVRAGSGFSDKRASLENKQKDLTLDVGNKLRTRFALQQIVLQCMAELNLDAVTYPTGNVPAPKLGAPTEPTVNGRSALAWTLLGANGFPAISVPAGFTTEVYDRVPDAAARVVPAWSGPCPRSCRWASISSAGRSASPCCFASLRPTRAPPIIAGRRAASAHCKDRRNEYNNNACGSACVVAVLRRAGRRPPRSSCRPPRWPTSRPRWKRAG